MIGNRHFTFELFSAGVLIIWGAFTLNPYDQSFAKNPQLFAPMLFLVNSQIFWGAFFFALGVFGIVLNYRNRGGAAFVMGCVYLFFTSLFIFGDFNSRAWAYYFWIALFNLIHWKGYLIQRQG